MTYFLLGINVILVGIIVYMSQKNAKDVVSAYHSGLNKVDMPKTPKKAKVVKRKDEDLTLEEKLMLNVDRYDGTSLGQIKL